MLAEQLSDEQRRIRSAEQEVGLTAGPFAFIPPALLKVMLERSGLPGWLRSLLAALAVLASFMHLTRSSSAGGLGAGGWRVVALALPDGVSSHSHAGPGPLAGAEVQARLALEKDYGHSQKGPPETAGHSEHGDYHQAAHCPFCLTNAFALDAELAGLPQGPPRALPQPLRSMESCVVITIRHADARAPPFES